MVAPKTNSIASCSFAVGSELHRRVSPGAEDVAHVLVLRGRLLLWLCILAKPFGVQFSLVSGLIDVLANLSDVFVITCRLNVDNKALSIRRANKPPIRKSRVGSEEH
jgi:hypothetical protein